MIFDADLELTLCSWRWEHEHHTNIESIANRLELLASEAVSDDDQEPMNVGSLEDVLEFLVTRPSLTLNPMGHISASWTICDHKLVVRFLGDGKISGILLKND